MTLLLSVTLSLTLTFYFSALKAKAKLSMVSLCRLSMRFYYSFIQFISSFIKEKFISPFFSFFNIYENCNKKAYHLGQCLDSESLTRFWECRCRKTFRCPFVGVPETCDLLNQLLLHLKFQICCFRCCGRIEK